MDEEYELRFGVVIFDDETEPGAGWASSCLNGRPGPAKRIAGHNELPTDTIWWSNISYEHFFRGRSEPWRNPNLRHDKYLVVGPKDVLREWGHDPTNIDPDFVCTFNAQAFERIMRIAWRLLSDANPKARIENVFQGKTLREDLRPLLPGMEYPKLEAADVFKSGQAWEEFTATGVRGPRGGKWVVLRRPRVSYGMAMLNTPVPTGPYDFLTRHDLRQLSKDRVQYVKDSKRPCVADVSVIKIQPEVAPIYGFGAATDKDKRVMRSWVAGPEFEILAKFAEVEVRSLYQAAEYRAMVPEMIEPVREFLDDKFTDFSWAAGIVVESLWRAVTLGESKGKAGPMSAGESRAMTSWQGLWLRAADKSQMFKNSMRLAELGYAVLSYGLGWVRCMVGEEEVANLIKDGLSLGLLPLLSDVPDKIFGDVRSAPWDKDDKRSESLSRLVIGKQSQMLWKLDKVPTLIGSEERREYVRKLQGDQRKAG